MKKLCQLIWWIGAAAWLIIGTAWPASASTFGVIPKTMSEQPNRSWFVHTLSPNTIQDDVVVVSNNGDKAITVELAALDAVNATQGSFTLVKDTTQNQDVGKWINLSKTIATIPAGSSTEIPFSITVPSDAGPGEHSGGIAVWEKKVGQGGSILADRDGGRISGVISYPTSRLNAWSNGGNFDYSC